MTKGYKSCTVSKKKQLTRNNAKKDIVKVEDKDPDSDDLNYL